MFIIVITNIVSSYFYFIQYNFNCLVVLLAEDDRLCEELKQRGISSQTIAGVEKDPNCAIGVFPAKMLGEAYTYLGMNC